MEERYYSEYISEDFQEKIYFLKKEKGLTLYKEFAFIFVNSKTYECKHVLEKNLSSTKMNNETFTNIVVLGYRESTNENFLNRHYAFIEIFDMKGNESYIDLGGIALNTISIRYENYNTNIISSCNISLFWAPFKKYMEKVLEPIDGVILSSLKDDNWLRYSQRTLKPCTIDISLKYNLYINNGFDSLLKDLKNFEINLNNNVVDFDPEITLKPDITLKIKSNEIQF